MGTYSIAQAKDQLSRLIDEALTGEIVTITRHGKPVVSLTPSAPAPRPVTEAEIEQMRLRRSLRPSLGAELRDFSSGNAR